MKKKFSVCLAALVGMACIPAFAPAAETKTAYCYPGGCSPCVMRPYNPCGYGSCGPRPIYTSPSYSYYTMPSYNSYGGYGGVYTSPQPGMYQPSYGGGYAPLPGPTSYPAGPGFAPPSGGSGPAPSLGPAMGPSNFPMPPGMANPSAYPATYPGYNPYSQPGYAVPYSSRGNADLTSQTNTNSPFYP